MTNSHPQPQNDTGGCHVATETMWLDDTQHCPGPGRSSVLGSDTLHLLIGKVFRLLHLYKTATDVIALNK